MLWLFLVLLIVWGLSAGTFLLTYLLAQLLELHWARQDGQ